MGSEVITAAVASAVSETHLFPFFSQGKGEKKGHQNDVGTG
jgi:hypothetical protein